MTSHLPIIRKATLNDVVAIQHCVDSAYEHYVAIIGKPPGPMLDDYALVVEKHLVYVAELDFDVAGVLVLITSAEGILLDNVAVFSTFQGRGIGRQLIEFAEATAVHLGYQQIELYTHVLMTDNFEIYRRLGYQETGRREVNGYQRIYMQKTLSA